MKRKPKILRIILLAIISCVIGIAIYNINAKMLLRDSYPMIEGFATNVILSGSMEPELSVDDMIVVHEQDSYNTDDIVVFIDKGNVPVAHRIISIDDSNNVTTKGDANNTPDKAFDAKNIKGKVIFKIPKLGIFINDYTKIGLVVLVVILLVISFIREAKGRDKDKDKIKSLQDEINRLKQQ
ncbi:MAG: signal peptidase I [Coriobacteriia bacterium]|nr:signal peptidase I [Coriobacteriia bacterium]